MLLRHPFLLVVAVLALGSAPSQSVTIDFVFDFTDDQFDGTGTMSFGNDPGGGGGFNESFDNLVDLSISWNLPNTSGFDESHLVELASETLLAGSGAAPSRSFLLDHLLLLSVVSFVNGSAEALVFIADGTNNVTLETAATVTPVTGTFTATEVPEPSPMQLVATGLLMLGAWRRRAATPPR